MEENKKIEKVLDIIAPDTETTCPSCGGFVGTYDLCPRCGADIKKRVSLKFFKYFSLVLGILGLFFLYLWSINRELDKVDVASITESMNFAYVRVAGRVIRDTRINYGPNGQPLSLNFTLDDGSGTIKAMAFKHVTQELAKKGEIPKQEDQVSLCGVLRVKKGDDLSIMIQVPEQVKITRVNIPTVPIPQINDKLKGKAIQVEGRVKNIQTPKPNSKAPVVLELEDEGNVVDVKVWQNIFNDLIQESPLKMGDKVALRCVVDEYKGKLQLSVSNSQDIKRLTEVDRYLNIQDISNQYIGQPVMIKGKIDHIYPGKGERGPRMKWDISDSTGSIQVSLWKSPYDDIPNKESYQKGTVVSLRGRVREYRDKLEIHPYDVNDIKIIEKQNTPTPPATNSESIPISSISEELEGKVVSLKAKVTKQSSFKDGIRLNVSDDSGKSITVIIWNQILKDIGNLELPEGTSVWVQGKVSKFKDRLQIQLEKASDLRKEEK